MMTKEEIQAADDTVLRCLEVALAPELRPRTGSGRHDDDSTYYLIETKLSFPRFVVGEAIEWRDSAGKVTNVGTRQILKCGAEWSARKFWTNLLAGVPEEVIQ